MSGAASSSFIEAAKGLAPQIEASADEIERSRRLPLPLVDTMAHAGLFRLSIPRTLGGEETDLMTLVRVVEEVSRADGAAGWCLAIGGEYGAFGGYTSGGLERCVRDIHAVGQHLTLAPPNYQMAGQAFLDLDMRATPLLFMDDRSPN